MRTFPKLICSLLFCAAPAAMAGVVLQPTPASELQVSSWLNADPGSLADNRGRIVLIGFFRMTCPESRAFLIPLFRRWNALYGEREDVSISLVHGSLEGHDSPTPEGVREFVRENGISYAVGIDVGGQVPPTMRRYGVRGTPHLAIVDKEGLLRFTLEGIFDIEPIETFIERLLEEIPGTVDPTTYEASLAERPRPASGTDLSGTYLFRTDQATGLCAPFVPPMEAPAKLRVYRDAIDIEFVRPLVGMDMLEVRFDAETGRVDGESELSSSGIAGFASGRVVRLEGVLDAGVRPPELAFELSFPGGSCTVRGTARGEL
jgi:hypothetical protein